MSSFNYRPRSRTRGRYAPRTTRNDVSWNDGRPWQNPAQERRQSGRSFFVDKIGDTVSPDGIARRAFVKNFPRHVSITDLKRFFGGDDKVEGITLYSNYAVVQFKRPPDLTEALEKHNDLLHDKRIHIDRYDDVTARREAVRRQQPEITLDEVARDVERSRRVRESILATERSRSSSSSSSRSSAVSSINNLNEDIDNSRSSVRGEQLIDSGPSTSNQPEIPSVNHDANINTLPSVIETNLKLVISGKSAEMLTVPQIRDIVKYFQSEIVRINIRRNENENQDELVDEEPPDEETIRMMEKCVEFLNY